MSSNTVINTNGRSTTSRIALKAQGNKINRASKRLATGKKVNSAADDAAGLAISDKMTAQIRGLDMASKNTEDGISLIQTVESNVGEINNMVQRIRELAVQSANDTNEGAAGADRAKIQEEVNQLTAEIDSMAGRAEFNKIKLNSTGQLKFQVGANKDQTIGLQLQSITCAKLNSGLSGINISTQASANDAISTCDAALKTVETYRAKLGAVQNRLEFTDSNVQNVSNNLQDARSGIVDADIAKEMSDLTASNTLQQAAISMVAQANSSSQNLMSLLS